MGVDLLLDTKSMRRSQRRNTKQTVHYISNIPRRVLLITDTRKESLSGFNNTLPQDITHQVIGQLKQTNNTMRAIIDSNYIAQIDSSQKKITVKLHKYHAYIAYLLEFGYDLAIRPSLNVSQNPGFESLIGVFDCEHDDE